MEMTKRFYEPTPFSFEGCTAEPERDAVKENWNRMALQFMRVTKLRQRDNYTRFTAEDIARLAVAAGIPPATSVRSWGPVFQRAKREGMIEQATYKGIAFTAPTSSKHRSPVWQWARG